jgi:hypothetical protein
MLTRASQCTSDASVRSFAVAANSTAVDPALSTAQLAELLHSAARTVRITAMVRKEPTAPIKVLLADTPPKPRTVVHSALLSFLITTVVSSKHQDGAPSFIRTTESGAATAAMPGDCLFILRRTVLEMSFSWARIRVN